MEIVYLIIGIAIGGLSGWFIARSRFAKPEGIPVSSLEINYVQKSLFEALTRESKIKDEEIIQLNRTIAQYEEKAKNLQERIDNHKKELTELQESMKCLELKLDQLQCHCVISF